MERWEKPAGGVASAETTSPAGRRVRGDRETPEEPAVSEGLADLENGDDPEEPEPLEDLEGPEPLDDPEGPEPLDDPE